VDLVAVERVMKVLWQQRDRLVRESCRGALGRVDALGRARRGR